MELLYLLVGLAIGSTAVYLILKNKNTSINSISLEKINLLEADNAELKSVNENKLQEIITLNNKLTQKETEYKHLAVRIEEQKEEQQKLTEKLNLEFKNLANEILDEKTRKFTIQNKENLSEILNPFNDKIKEFEKKVQDTYDKEAQQRFSLKEEVKRLSELNLQISKEANSLTKALKGESKTQGNWGEMILESILDKTGLRKGEEYTVQSSFTLDDGKRFQPDVIVHYPGKRSIVIDSKVSLTAYERYTSASEDEQENELKAHLLSVRNHIKELSAKKYEDLPGVKTLDFVMMFLPVEPAYMLAIQHDPQLWSFAYEKRILMISPTNLVAVLKMIESLWEQDSQNKNVLEIARQGGALYDDFVLLSERLIKLGKNLEASTDIYKETMKKITSGRGNLVGRVENLKALGVKAKKQMPDKLIQRALEDIEGEEGEE